MAMVEERACRACGGRIDSVLNLGMLALSNFPRPQDPPAATAPLDLCQCQACGLVQLRHTIAPDVLFRQYWYRSGINETMRAELQSIVTQARTIVPVAAGDVVVDVGANDGTLLRAYPPDVLTIAFEPALNLNEALHHHAHLVVADYFPQGLAQLESLRGRVKILSSIACFYDLDDPGAFVAAVAEILAPEGVWIVQFQDLHQMLQATAFDNVVHEHLVYYSLRSFERLIAPYGLRVTHAERRAINGGSYRLLVQHNTAGPRDATVAALRQTEQGCEHWLTLERFAWRVGEARTQIHGALAAVPGTIDLYGASTKGNVLLQYCGLDGTLIRQAWERDPEKVGRQTITGIPIVSEATGRADPPDLILVGIWQFREAVLRREAAYLEAGGRILFPLPVVDLVEGGW